MEHKIKLFFVDGIYEYWCKCPVCGELIEFDDYDIQDEIEKDGESYPEYYSECSKCDTKILACELYS